MGTFFDDEDKDLPMATFGEVEGVDPPPQGEPVDLAVQEYTQWKDTFEASLMDINTCMATHHGKVDPRTGIVMHSYESVFKYCHFLRSEALPTPERAKEQREEERLTKSERKAKLDEAKRDWHEAVAKRAEAMIQWNAYVAAKRQVVKDLS